MHLFFFLKKGHQWPSFTFRTTGFTMPKSAFSKKVCSSFAAFITTTTSAYKLSKGSYNFKCFYYEGRYICCESSSHDGYYNGTLYNDS